MDGCGHCDAEKIAAESKNCSDNERILRNRFTRNNHEAGLRAVCLLTQGCITFGHSTCERTHRNGV